MYVVVCGDAVYVLGRSPAGILGAPKFSSIEKEIPDYNLESRFYCPEIEEKGRQGRRLGGS